jgi:hypothetical protein
MHRAAFEFCVRAMDALPIPEGLIVEIGARNVNGSVRYLFPDSRFLGVDIAPGPGVDIVADGATVTVAEPAAVVVTTEVLEHTAQAPAICANAHRLLMSGGVLIVTCAGIGRAPHSAVDGWELRDGEYYQNVSREMLADWLAPFVNVTIEENTVAAVAHSPRSSGCELEHA